MARRPGPDKPAALLPEAVDPFLVDQPLDQRERVRGVGQQPVRPLRIDLGGAPGKALADIDAAADRAAVARAGADPEGAPFEHDRLDPVPRQFERGGEPGIAGADDRDPRLARHIGKLAARRPVRLPPIRLGDKVGVEKIGPRHSLPPQS